jgi:ABC-type nitrate/sulfonate/bicarbonate transport system substrate-binding protein
MIREGKTIEVNILVEPTISSLPIHYAEEKGLFAEENIETNINRANDPQAALDALASGEADFAVVPWTDAFKWMDEKTDTVRCFFSVEFKKGLPQDGLFPREDLKFKDITEVEGRSVGLTAQTQTAFVAILSAMDIDPATVEIKVYPPEKLMEAFEAGEVDLILPVEPYFTVAQLTLGNAYRGGSLLPSYINDPYPASGVFVSSEYYRKNNMAMLRMTKVLDVVTGNILNEPDTALAVVGRTFAITDEEVISEINLPVLVRVKDIDKDVLQEVVDKLEFFGTVNTAINIAETGIIIPHEELYYR